MSFTSDEVNLMFDPAITDNAIFFHAGGFPVTIPVIYDNDYLASLGIESSAPVAICRTSDVASASHGDTLTIIGDINTWFDSNEMFDSNETFDDIMAELAYYIIEVQTEGQFTTLILSRDKDG